MVCQREDDRGALLLGPVLLLFTGSCLIATFAEPIYDQNGNMIAVMDLDFKFND